MLQFVQLRSIHSTMSKMVIFITLRITIYDTVPQLAHEPQLRNIAYIFFYLTRQTCMSEISIPPQPATGHKRRNLQGRIQDLVKGGAPNFFGRFC